MTSERPGQERRERSGRYKSQDAASPRHLCRHDNQDNRKRRRKSYHQTTRFFIDMESLRAFLFLYACVSLLTLSLCRGQRSATPDDDNLTQLADDELAEALQDFLDEAESRSGLSVEKKASVIPRCDVGERCAMKHGPRIGRLCDCLRGTACNTFFLRCY
ncbi:cocaine- and amphetamine-regulated transcript 4 [Stigmatopora argus]